MSHMSENQLETVEVKSQPDEVEVDSMGEEVKPLTVVDWTGAVDGDLAQIHGAIWDFHSVTS